MTKRWIGYAEMSKKLGVSRTQIQHWVACRILPKPPTLGSHKTSRTVWWEHEVDAAMEAMASRGIRPEQGLEARRETGGLHAFLCARGNQTASKREGE